MRSCFVSIPFGSKPLSDGRSLDFDYLYSEIVKPAVEAAGVECRRLDEYPSGAIWHKTLFAAVISSDFVIADISSDNPNVFYELGVRHALRPGRTILISAGGHVPADIGNNFVLFYQSDANGRLTGDAAEKFRAQLVATIEQSQGTTSNDSPIYEFFPELEVLLPSELEVSLRRRRIRKKGERSFVQKAVESPDQAKGELEISEAEVRGAPDADPSEYLNLLKRYRDLSEWERVIALADDAPPELAKSVEVRQLLALALNRRGKEGDQDRAIALMQQQIAETGGDSETFGIIGRIYKDRYDQAREQGNTAEAATNLEQAIDLYKQGFMKNPRDYYPGINVVNLLLQRGDDKAREELSELVPKVSAALQEKLQVDRPDFWDLATDLQLAAVARDWSRAETRARAMLAQSPPNWMLETTLRDIRAVGNTFQDPNDQSNLQTVVSLIKPVETQNGGTV